MNYYPIIFCAFILTENAVCISFAINPAHVSNIGHIFAQLRKIGIEIETTLSALSEMEYPDRNVRRNFVFEFLIREGPRGSRTRVRSRASGSAS